MYSIKYSIIVICILLSKEQNVSPSLRSSTLSIPDYYIQMQKLDSEED